MRRVQEYGAREDTKALDAPRMGITGTTFPDARRDRERSNSIPRGTPDQGLNT